jgi:sulfur-carrier protein
MKFKLAGNMLRFSNFQKEIEIAAVTVETAVQSLVEHCPDLRPVLLDGEGRVRQVHRLFLNGEMLPPHELGRQVGSQDEVAIITAIAGG